MNKAVARQLPVLSRRGEQPSADRRLRTNGLVPLGERLGWLRKPRGRLRDELEEKGENEPGRTIPRKPDRCRTVSA